MSITTTTMTSCQKEFTVASPMLLQPPRPQYARQRSNSLPAGLANMNAQEAGMLFSAAERATARRQRPFSVHSSHGVDQATKKGPAFHVRFDSAATIKPVPPPKDTPPAQQEQPTSAPSTVISRRQNQSRALRDLDVNHAMNGRSPAALVSTLKSLPIPMLSPTKRQVGNPTLKSYADGLFQFTQTRLVAKIPNILSPPPTAIADVFDDSHGYSKVASPARPSLESKWSDWSIATSDRRESYVQETELLVPGLAPDSSLLSPDSFFGSYDNTPRKKEFAKDDNENDYPSSEVYGPQVGDYQPLTPPNESAAPIMSPIEEFSYFTNYDQYLDNPSTTQADVKGATEALENLAIEISPIAPSPYVATTSHVAPHRVNSDALRAAVTRSCSGTPVYAIPPTCSLPTTPYQKADVAVRIPNWLIGAIG